jgi:hypothetical protein
MTAEKPREKILDQLRKLHAMAESAQALGNEHEAQAFAAKVQELLTAYKLSQAAIRTGETKPDEPINSTYVGWKDLGLENRRIRIAWAERLGQFVCRAYYCDFVVANYDGNIGMVIGAETDRKIATYMFVTLGRFLYDLAEREYVKAFHRAKAEGNVALARGFKAGFTAGFLQRLKERFDEEVTPKADGPLSNSLAIVAVRKNSLDKVRGWMKSNLNLRFTRGPQLSDGSGEGRSAGKAAANGLDLNRKGIERAGGAMPLLGGGR